jgi:chromosome segregation ATPase
MDAAAAIEVFGGLQRDVEKLTQLKSQLDRQVQQKQEQLQQLQSCYDELKQQGNAEYSRQEQLWQKIQDEEEYLAATKQRVEEKVGEWAGRNRAAKQREQELQQREQEMQQWEQELQQWQEYREYRDQVDIDLERQETQYMHLAREIEQLTMDEKQLQVRVDNLKNEAAAAQETKRVRIALWNCYNLLKPGVTTGIFCTGEYAGCTRINEDGQDGGR